MTSLNYVLRAKSPQVLRKIFIFRIQIIWASLLEITNTEKKMNYMYWVQLLFRLKILGRLNEVFFNKYFLIDRGIIDYPDFVSQR